LQEIAIVGYKNSHQLHLIVSGMECRGWL